jgi:hypothetical protein
MSDAEIAAMVQYGKDLAANGDSDEVRRRQQAEFDAAEEAWWNDIIRQGSADIDDVPLEGDEISARPAVPAAESRNAGFLVAVKSFSQAYGAMNSDLPLAERVRAGAAAVEQLSWIQRAASDWQGARQWLEECAARGITRPAIAIELQQLKQELEQSATSTPRGHRSSDNSGDLQ